VKVFLIVFSVIVVAALAAVAATALTKRHAVADVERETRSATGFNRIDVSGLAEVTLQQGSSESVTVEAPAQMLSRIKTEVRERTLTVTISQQRHWWDWFEAGSRGRTPRITIEFVKIERIESAGSIKFKAGALRADDLRIDVAGASSLKISDLQANRLWLDGSGAISADIAGKVGTQQVDLSGAGSYRAGALVSDKADIRVSGAGKAIVNTASLLKVDISGAGAVEYLGDPKIEQRISGVGKVRRRD
jgi:Putative auto-transporter adhesin, head GIN domain